MNCIPEPLVGNEQQRLAGQRRTIPLRTVSGRKGRGCADDPIAPLIFVPALGEFTAQQERLGQLEMGAGRAWVERQGAASEGDAVIELQPAVMDERQIVQGLEIVPVDVKGVM